VCNQCIAVTHNGRCRMGARGANGSGKTCKTGPHCWIHTKQKEGLRVKDSTVAGGGLGLFAAKHFVPGEKIGDYSNVPEEDVFRKKKQVRGQTRIRGVQFVNEKTGEKFDGPGGRYPDENELAEYAQESRAPNEPVKVHDARNTNSGVIRYANSCKWPDANGRLRQQRPCNAKMVNPSKTSGKRTWEKTWRQQGGNLVAREHVEPGDEIFWDYGSDYHDADAQSRDKRGGDRRSAMFRSHQGARVKKTDSDTESEEER
jgi:hypothetical protein